MRPVLPTMSSLLDDPVFRAYMKKVPPKHQANTTGQPWQIWVRTHEGKWRTGLFQTYRDAWPVFLKGVKGHADATITSRRVFYAPPGEWYNVKVRRARKPSPNDASTSHVVVETRWRQLFHWEIGLEWCGRCRRPTYWQPLNHTHHALKRQPTIAPDDNVRCCVCGIRWIAMPDVDQMVRPAP